MKKIFKILAYLLLTLIILLVGFYFVHNEKLPVGKTGAAADALAQKMMQAVNKTAWDSTPIISWQSRVGNKYLWDKNRNWVQVEWKNNKVLLDIGTAKGKAWTDGTAVADAEKGDKLVKEAYKFFLNDAFWLNPVVKLFDEGVERSIVPQPDGTEGLMVTYKSGGVTPGDSYLWLVDKNGLPIAWKLWVKILPIGGISASWERWETLASGAKVATFHRLSKMEIPILNLKSGANWAVFGLQSDPFGGIF
jgi:hypothetical protein